MFSLLQSGESIYIIAFSTSMVTAVILVSTLHVCTVCVRYCEVLCWKRLCVCVSLCLCVCLSVSVREDISGTTVPYADTRDLYQLFCTCCLWPWLGPLAGRRTPKGKGQFRGFSSPLYSMAFGTYTKTAEPIEMPFGMMSGLGPRNSVLSGVTGSEGEGAICRKTCARQA